MLFRSGRAAIERWSAAIHQALRGGGAVLVTTAHDTDDLARFRGNATAAGWDGREMAVRVERLLREVLHPVIALPSAVIATGGATGEVLLDLMGDAFLEIGSREILPGAPLAVVRGGEFSGLRFVTKPGSFGDEDALARMVSFLQQPA